MTKKTIMSCLLVVLFLAVLTSCFDASVGTISSETKNDTTEMETGPALVKTELDAEALVSVRAIADEALKNQYGILLREQQPLIRDTQTSSAKRHWYLP